MSLFVVWEREVSDKENTGTTKAFVSGRIVRESDSEEAIKETRESVKAITKTAGYSLKNITRT